MLEEKTFRGTRERAGLYLSVVLAIFAVLAAFLAITLV